MKNATGEVNTRRATARAYPDAATSAAIIAVVVSRSRSKSVILKIGRPGGTRIAKPEQQRDRGRARSRDRPAGDARPHRRRFGDVESRGSPGYAIAAAARTTTTTPGNTAPSGNGHARASDPHSRRCGSAVKYP